MDIQEEMVEVRVLEREEEEGEEEEEEEVVMKVNKVLVKVEEVTIVRVVRGDVEVRVERGGEVKEVETEEKVEVVRVEEMRVEMEEVEVEMEEVEVVRVKMEKVEVMTVKMEEEEVEREGKMEAREEVVNQDWERRLRKVPLLERLEHRDVWWMVMEVK